VRLVVVNAGDKGSFDASTDPGDLTEQRAREVAAAAEVMGLAGVEMLGVPDGEALNDLPLRGRLVGLVRRLRPDVVIAPDPTAVFFGDSYVNHRDHREVGWAVLDAVAPAAASPLYFPEEGPPYQVPTVLLSGTLEADAWVDVTATIDAKVAAVACHASRVGDDPELVADLLRARTTEAGAIVGVAHAEGYRRLRLA
jgi:LmbE family N-acetylglucosaminyl deacetylase